MPGSTKKQTVYQGNDAKGGRVGSRDGREEGMKRKLMD